MRAAFFVVALSMILLSTAALAAVPGLMNYQGTLTDADGVALDTTVAMTFTIYYDSTGGASIWTETQPAVEVTSGIFNVLLGSVNPLSEALFGGTPSRWLGVQVGGDPELMPRQRIVTVAHAFHAAAAETADYALSAPAAGDSDWTISGNNMYSAVSGNVGIGTASPLCKLDVSGSNQRIHVGNWVGPDGSGATLSDGDSSGAVFSNNAYHSGVGWTNQNTGKVGAFIQLSDDDIYVRRSGSGSAPSILTNMFIDGASGNVGLGTSSPNAKLDVSGDVNSDSLYKIKDNTVLATPRSTNNIHVGVGAGGSSTGDYETFLGRNAGPDNEGNYNTFLGYTAGYSNTTGHSNTFAGLAAGYGNTTGIYNTFLGRSAGQNNTEGHDNTFVGYYAGFYNETGNYNTFLGTRAGLNTTGTSNTFIGHYTGYDNTGGNYNTFVGRQAGGKNTTGSSNVYLGNATGYNNSTGTANTFIGDYAGFSNTGSSNIFIGNYAGYFETGSNKLYIANSTDSSDVLIYGDFASGRVGLGTLIPEEMLHVENPGSGQSAFLKIETSHPSNWHEAGLRIQTPQNMWHLRMDDDTNNNIPNGALGLRSQDLGAEVMVWQENGNVGIGTSSPDAKLDVNGEINTEAQYQIDGATVFAHSADHNLMVGAGAGENNTGDQNTFVGDSTGVNNQDDGCTFLGYRAGRNNITGRHNLFVGMTAGYNNLTGDYNTFVGTGAGSANTEGFSNTCLGYNAGTLITTGDCNVCLGNYSGGSTTTGQFNVFIGSQAGYHETGSNKLYIAKGPDDADVLIYGDFSTGRVGIGTTSPGATLALEDSLSARTLDVVNTYSGHVLQTANIERTQTVGSGNDLLQILVPDGSNDGLQFIECQRGSDVEFRVDGDGDVFADGIFTPGGADVAELITVSAGAFTVEPGDVMVIDPANSRATTKSAGPRSTLVAGIYSTRPGFLGSERDWDKPAGREDAEMGTYTMEEMATEFNEVPLAVVGIVPCKVSAENGAIRPGDLLVTSGTPGHAMRDDDPKVGSVVGKALESLSSGTGKIKVLVTLH